LNYIGMFLAWFIALMISFFGGMISMLVFLVGGAGVPSPVSYIFQVVFISLIGFLFYTIITIIAGRPG